MGTRNEAAPWWSPKAAAAWERLAAEIDTLEQAEQERDQAARRYLAALMEALREGRPAPNMSEFEAYGRGGGDDPEGPQYDPGPGGGSTSGAPAEGQSPVWQPSDYPAVPGSDEYTRIAQEGDDPGRGVTVSSGVPAAPPGPIAVAPGVAGAPIAVAPALPSGYSPPRPLPAARPQPTQAGSTPGPRPTVPAATPGPGYTPGPDNGPGDFGATPVVGPGPYLNDGGAATAVPTAGPPPTSTPGGNERAGVPTPQGPDENRDWRKDRQVGRDVIDALARAGHDIHVEKGATGTDVYADPDGNLYVKPKGGQGPGTPLYVNRKDLDL